MMPRWVPWKPRTAVCWRLWPGLWRGKGTASPSGRAGGADAGAAGGVPGRDVHRTGDAAFHGESLVVAGTTWTTRLPANAVLYGPRPPRTGKRGRPRVKWDRLGACVQIAASAAWAGTVINVYGHDTAVQVADAGALWHGSVKGAPGRVVLVRDRGQAVLGRRGYRQGHGQQNGYRSARSRSARS